MRDRSQVVAEERQRREELRRRIDQGICPSHWATCIHPVQMLELYHAVEGRKTPALVTAIAGCIGACSDVLTPRELRAQLSNLAALEARDIPGVLARIFEHGRLRGGGFHSGVLEKRARDAILWAIPNFPERRRPR